MIRSEETAHPVTSLANASGGRPLAWGSLAQAAAAAYVLVATAVAAASVFLASAASPAARRPASYLPEAVGVLLLLIGAWALFALRGQSEGRALAALSASLAMAAATFFDLFNARSLILAWIVGTCIAGVVLIDLAFLFPRRSALLVRFPFLRVLLYGMGIAVAAILALAYLRAPTLGRTLPPLRLMLLGGVVYFLVTMVAAFRAPALVTRTQARLLTAATAFALLPLGMWLAAASTAIPSFASFVFLPTLALPLVLAATMQRFSMAGTARWLRQAAIHGFVSVLILGAYAALVAGLSILLGTLAPTLHPLWVGGFALLFAIMLAPLRNHLQAVADRTFFRGQRAVDESVQEFTHRFARAAGHDEIARIVRESARSAVDATDIHIFHYDELNDQFTALRDESGHPSTDLRFPGQGPLAQMISQLRLPMHLDGGALPPAIQSEKSRLSILRTSLILALAGRDRPLGWIALGAPRAGATYSSNDMILLEQLAGQAALALSRIETVERLERRIQEMNALTRVAQGVNITLTYNDVLELIYAQTSQIVPFSHFRITLHRPEEDNFHLAFAVDRNERLTSRENVPLPSRAGLSREVIRRGRPIITQNYDGECATLGVEPLAKGILAWMGVPLNAGAESIGALSVGNHEPGVVYTPAQLDLLQAVADQTAGAIVKARLLRETQQRVAQLGRLNEVARQLASIRDLEALRQAVVDGAGSILGCEAAILYSVDQPTGQLNVIAFKGPLSGELVNQHVGAQTGNAGRVVSSRNASIQNDVAPGSGSDYLDQPGSGFVPRTSLAVPLLVQDTIIGVLELLNRTDATPFVPEDQALLLAFAGQAAAALENVRLYTLTDQELTARVEELSVMQRIDRELNASLEMDRAMRITLEWALRQSGADAGLIGLLEEGRLRIVTEMGYGRPLGDGQDHTVGLTMPGFQAAIESGLPQRVRFETGSGGFLPAADHQVVVPIRREANVIGLLILESLTATQEDVGFLSRLSDHAAIAISNAQLYDEVQRANLAKSDFVSLVAHELKNPMTSIKGYTELLVAGAVGEVNEMQAGFLGTIRSNTERMSTLVSDLNDNSKIEAGRLRLDFKSVELGELIDETVRSSMRQIEEKKQSVRLDLPDRMPPVWSDRTRLGQVLTNLISNANKYTPEGGTIVIGAETASNHWDPEGASEVVHLWVRDNGIGISAEDQQKIFQKFFRSEDPKTREAPGAGLGLNITRSLVEMQGGRIWFESQYRQGTTFHFTVPVAEARP